MFPLGNSQPREKAAHVQRLSMDFEGTQVQFSKTLTESDTVAHPVIPASGRLRLERSRVPGQMEPRGENLSQRTNEEHCWQVDAGVGAHVQEPTYRDGAAL